MYANVITEITAKSEDKTFTYIIPNKNRDLIKVGARVKEPLLNEEMLYLAN